MTNLITEARELCESATPGPWYWDVIDAHKCICLESARWKVMDFARYGMNGAAPRFLVDGIMERADTLLKSIPGKEHHRGFDNYIDHPDADFIARSRTLIPELCDALEKAEETKNEELNKAHDAGFYAGQKYALREKLEREKGCDACGLIYKLDGGSYETDDEIIDNKFCPMCGKRLEVQNG